MLVMMSFIVSYIVFGHQKMICLLKRRFIAGREFGQICYNCALCDKFLQFGMVVDIDIEILKTIANELWWPPGGLYAQNPKWPPPGMDNLISQLL